MTDIQDDVPAQRPAKLPVWRTTRECYRLVYTNIGPLIQISWRWLLVMIPVYAVAHAAVWYFTFAKGAPILGGPASGLISNLPNILELGFLASVAVGWHQLILRSKSVSTPKLYLDQTGVAYACWVFMQFLAPTIILMVILPGWPTDNSSTPERLFWYTVATSSVVLMDVLSIVAVLIIPLRLSLKLPAVALQRSMSLQESWQITRGNTWRLAATAFLCWLPCFLMFIATGIPLTSFSDKPALVNFVMSSTVMSLAYAIPTIFGVTLLSLAYRHFVEPDAQATPA
jgi:hypothetical protein